MSISYINSQYNRINLIKQSRIRFRELKVLINAIPPSFMVLLSILSLQVGSATAKTLFTSLSALGVVFLRIGFAAIVMWFIARPEIRQYSKKQWCYAAMLGTVIALINMAFYEAIARVPLGIVVTIEFLGPFAVALMGSKKRSDFFWPMLAFGGILLLTPIGNLAKYDTTGLLLSFLAAICFALYIILTSRTSAMFEGISGLTLALTFAALIMMPIGIAKSGTALLNSSLLFQGFLIAMLSTTIPFSLEFLALKKMSPRNFGIWISLEPAVAAIVGFILLNELLGIREWTAIILVCFATIGVTVYKKSD